MSPHLLLRPWPINAGPRKLDRSLTVPGRLHRRDLHVHRGGLAAAVPDEGDQRVLEATRSHPLLLQPHHNRHGSQPGPWHMRHGLRLRESGVSGRTNYAVL